MKTKQKIFDIKKLFCILAVVSPLAAYADYDDDNCRFFNPAYALCSVHSYNMGVIDTAKNAPANPTDAEQISEMNEIIAMKATVIAQQMKQQYDFLNATIKRFKTQLEKAVLTSKMEILTGTSATGSSGSSSSSASNGLSGTDDCDEAGANGVYDCLVRNITKIINAAEKDPTNARKQLVNDLDVARRWDICKKNNTENSECSNCDKITTNSYTNKETVVNCAKELRSKIQKKQKEESQRNNRYGGYYPG